MQGFALQAPGAEHHGGAAFLAHRRYLRFLDEQEQRQRSGRASRRKGNTATITTLTLAPQTFGGSDVRRMILLLEGFRTHAAVLPSRSLLASRMLLRRIFLFAQTGFIVMAGSDDGALSCWAIPARPLGAGTAALPVRLWVVTNKKSGWGAVTCFCASADGTIFSGHADCAVRVWRNGKCTQSLGVRHRAPVSALAVLPSGLIVSGDRLGHVRLWRSVGTATARRVEPVREFDAATPSDWGSRDPYGACGKSSESSEVRHIIALGRRTVAQQRRSMSMPMSTSVATPILPEPNDAFVVQRAGGRAALLWAPTKPRPPLELCAAVNAHAEVAKMCTTLQHRLVAMKAHPEMGVDPAAWLRACCDICASDAPVLRRYLLSALRQLQSLTRRVRGAAVRRAVAACKGKGEEEEGGTPRTRKAWGGATTTTAALGLGRNRKDGAKTKAVGPGLVAGNSAAADVMVLDATLRWLVDVLRAKIDALTADATRRMRAAPLEAHTPAPLHPACVANRPGKVPSDDTLPATLFAVLKIPDRSDDPDLFDERRVWRQRQELGETLPPFFVLHGATSSSSTGATAPEQNGAATSGTTKMSSDSSGDASAESSLTCEWPERAARLQKRFPDHSMAIIVAVLQKYGGHGGKAAHDLKYGGHGGKAAHDLKSQKPGSEVEALDCAFWPPSILRSTKAFFGQRCTLCPVQAQGPQEVVMVLAWRQDSGLFVQVACRKDAARRDWRWDRLGLCCASISSDTQGILADRPSRIMRYRLAASYAGYDTSTRAIGPLPLQEVLPECREYQVVLPSVGKGQQERPQPGRATCAVLLPDGNIVAGLCNWRDPVVIDMLLEDMLLEDDKKDEDLHGTAGQRSSHCWTTPREAHVIQAGFARMRQGRRRNDRGGTQSSKIS